MKSLDLSNFALIKPVKPKQWQLLTRKQRGDKKEKVINIAIIKPIPTKGFQFLGELFPKFQNVLDLAREKGYGAYRQGAKGKTVVIPSGVTP